MKIHLTVEDDDTGQLSMGITADTPDMLEVFRLLVAGAEMVVYNHVLNSLLDGGASAEEAAYAAPLRARLLAIEQITQQDMQPYQWIELGAAD